MRAVRENPPYAPSSFELPSVEEWCRVAPQWFPDKIAKHCFQCNIMFNVFTRRHHCRLCGGVYCDTCCKERVRIPLYSRSQRACTQCKDRVRATSLDDQELASTPSRKRALQYGSEKNADADAEKALCVRADPAAECHWNLLPEEVIYRIFSHIEQPAYFTLFRVCRGFYRLANADSMWRLLYCTRWNVSSSVTEDLGLEWRKVYKKKAISEKHTSSSERRLSSRPQRRSRQFLSRSQIMQPLDISNIENFQTLKIVMVGATGTGKSSLINALKERPFDQSIKPTIGASLHKCTLQLASCLAVNLDVWEFSGREKYRNLAPLYYQDAHAIMYVADLTNSSSLAVCEAWLEEIEQKGPTGIVGGLLLNKTDCVIDFSLNTTPQRNTLAEHPKIQFAERLSAKNAPPVKRAFETLATLLLTKQQKHK